MDALIEEAQGLSEPDELDVNPEYYWALSEVVSRMSEREGTARTWLTKAQVMDILAVPWADRK